jgi:DNA polymerase-3 subunit alpha
MAFGSRLVIDVDAVKADNGFMAELEQILQPARQGTCPVILRYSNGSAQAEIALGEGWKVQPSASVLERLEQLVGNQNVYLHYHREPASLRTRRSG